MNVAQSPRGKLVLEHEMNSLTSANQTKSELLHFN